MTTRLHITIGDLVASGETEIKTGPFGTQLKAAEYVDSGTPVINVRNVGFGVIRDADLEFIDSDTTARLSGHLLYPGDIVFGRKGAVERHAFIRPAQMGWVQGSDCIRLRISSTRVVPQFVSYSLLTEEHKSWMHRQCSHGATMASLNQDIVGRIALSLPPVQQQQQVSNILSAYDDLIENNTRRIAILEEGARRIFEEWFVHYRAPGCEGLPMVDSAIGPVPQGLELRQVGALYATASGGTPSRTRSEYFGGDIRWVKTKELLDCPIFETEEHITRKGLDASSAKLVPSFSVLVAMYGANIGQLGVLVEEAATNQACCAVIPRGPAGWAYAYLALRHARERLINLRAGAAQQNISQTVIRAFDLLYATDAIHARFEETASPFLLLSFNLFRQNANLRAQRDLLLPKLISGEIDVSRSAAALPEAAE